MILFPNERREPRVTVQELRRHLRDADEDRFYLTVALSRLAEERPRSRRSFPTMGIIVAVATGIGMLTADAPSLPGDHKATLVAEATLSPLVEPSEIVSSRTPPPRLSTIRPHRRGVTHIKTVKGIPAEKERSSPRPLSPGEFGRKAHVNANKAQN